MNCMSFSGLHIKRICTCLHIVTGGIFYKKLRQTPPMV